MKSKSLSDLAPFAMLGIVIAMNIGAFANATAIHSAFVQEAVVEWDPIDYGYDIAEILGTFILGTMITAPLATLLIRCSTIARSTAVQRPTLLRF